jgi:hypothetical protein
MYWMWGKDENRKTLLGVRLYSAKKYFFFTITFYRLRKELIGIAEV